VLTARATLCSWARTDPEARGSLLRAAARAAEPGGLLLPPTVIAGAPADALVHCGETRGPVVTIRIADSFDETFDADALGLASVLTPSQTHAQRAWRALPAGTVSINSGFRAGRAAADPELLDAVTRTKVVHLA
jgi:acyl-CoA reductase-like NAD-dependent aldehyde dehydrogenase